MFVMAGDTGSLGEYDAVKADTQNAFRMLRSGGTIIWDDYRSYWPPYWPGVVAAVQEEVMRPGRWVHVSCTDLVVYTAAD
jgi:hypothetical protein